MQDIDNNTYNSVIIGNQEWTVENLKTTKYNDGTPITNYWQSGNEIFYGWEAVNSNKLAPIGWHIPTDQEWSQLINYLNTDSIEDNSALKLKEIGSVNWLTKLIRYTQTMPFDSPISGSTENISETTAIYSIPTQENMVWTVNGGTIIGSTDNSRTIEWNLIDEMMIKVEYVGGYTSWNNLSQNNNLSTNESGFSALPAGYKSSLNSVEGIGYKAMFWSLPEGFQNVWYRIITNQINTVGRDWSKKYQQPQFGMSVRLINDN